MEVRNTRDGEVEMITGPEGERNLMVRERLAKTKDYEKVIGTY